MAKRLMRILEFHAADTSPPGNKGLRFHCNAHTCEEGTQYFGDERGKDRSTVHHSGTGNTTSPRLKSFLIAGGFNLAFDGMIKVVNNEFIRGLSNTT
ncbi:hypothetical protein EGR_05957 [Echinococcus granulosus]|uniref:Uncharacterized protein n=1 Tax=Echinococcus granulosus TaxID=6210 RepID=W6UZX3_ECHGR|nr:hypothetical protein EGR_05957 [Echinococcus granulosus]EUB59229.1 hypothetical protein EGR_05957 [Echinococcus granulosus]